MKKEISEKMLDEINEHLDESAELLLDIIQRHAPYASGMTVGNLLMRHGAALLYRSMPSCKVVDKMINTIITSVKEEFLKNG